MALNCLSKIFFETAPLRSMIGLKTSCYPLENHLLYMQLVPVTCISFVPFYGLAFVRDQNQFSSKPMHSVEKAVKLFLCRVVFI